MNAFTTKPFTSGSLNSPGVTFDSAIDIPVNENYGFLGLSSLTNNYKDVGPATTSATFQSKTTPESSPYSAGYSRLAGGNLNETGIPRVSGVTTNKISSSTSNTSGVTFSSAVNGPTTPSLSFLQPDFRAQEVQAILSGRQGTSTVPQNKLPNAGMVKDTGIRMSNAVKTAVPATAGAISSAGAMISGPASMAAYVSQQIGQSIAAAQSTATENQIQSDFGSNVKQHGVNVGLNAEIIRNAGEANRNRAETYGTIGSLFGPIGALIGHAIGSSMNYTPDLNTAASFSGNVNPTDNRVANSASTVAPSGQSNMIDNVSN